MNIAFDGAIFDSPSKNRGLGRYAQFLLNALYKVLTKDDSIFIVNYNGLIFNENFVNENMSKINIYLGPFVDSGEHKKDWLFAKPELEEIGAASIEQALSYHDIDVFIVFNHDVVPFDFPKIIKRRNICKTKFILILQDLIPLVMQEHYFTDRLKKNNYMSSISILKHVDYVLAISDSAKQDAIKYFEIDPNIIEVTHLGSTFTKKAKVNTSFNEIKNKYNISKPYILYTGGDDFRKNISGLIKGFAASDKNKIIANYQLIIVCDISKREIYERIIDSYKLHDKVVMTGYISDDELHLLYENARGFIFPSMYEGFGLPILEAMMYDLPVAASNASSMPEIVGKNGLLFDSKNKSDIAKSIELLLIDSELREENIKNSMERKNLFSWDNCAKATYNACKRLTVRITQNIQSKDKPHVAMFTPMPPDKSGIADYSAERLPFWNQYFTIDVYTRNIKNIVNDVNQNFKVYKYDDFVENSNQYDLIIYQMGNSDYHTEIFDYIQKYPGIIVLHDYNLKHLFLHLRAQKVISEEKFREAISLQYNENYSTHELRITRGGSCDTVLNRVVTANALGVIVHSDYAKKHIELVSANLPIIVAPLGSVEYNTTLSNDILINLRTKYNLKKENKIIASFGFVHTFKRIYSILETFAKYINTLPDKKNYKYLIVGEIFEEEKFNTFFTNLDRKYDVRSNIIITHWTPITEFEQWMYLPDIIFNLRYPTQGESSASLARLMMIGKPVVVTDVATFSEIPDNCCMKIRYDENECSDIENIFKMLSANDPKLSEIALNARYFMINKCSLDDNARKYSEIINKIHQMRVSVPVLVNSFLINKIYDIFKKYHGANEYININSDLPSIAESLLRLNYFSNKDVCDKNYKISVIFDATIFIEVFVQQAHRSGIYLTALNILKNMLSRNDIYVELYCESYNHEKVIKALSIDITFNLLNKLSFFIPDSNFKKKINEFDIFFSPVFAVPEIFMKVRNLKRFVLLYDALPILHPELFNGVKKTDTFNYKIIANSSVTEYYIGISKCTIKDYLNCGLNAKSNNLSVSYLAASELFYKCEDIAFISEVRYKYQIPENAKYVFSLCSIEPRKNLIFTIKAFVKFIEMNKIDDLYLVIGGGHWDSFISKFNDTLTDLGQYVNKIIRIGYVADEDLAPLYSDALAFVYPSLYEGFGLPPLEAMKCGTPVITSNVSSIPEVVGDAGLLINPNSEEEMLTALFGLYFDGELRATLSKKGEQRAVTFSWSSTTDSIIYSFKQALKKSAES